MSTERETEPGLEPAQPAVAVRFDEVEAGADEADEGDRAGDPGHASSKPGPSRRGGVTAVTTHEHGTLVRLNHTIPVT